jgi:hypothetical protein
VAAAPLGSPTRDTIHGAFAALGYVSLAAVPLTSAAPLAREGRQTWARLAVVAGATSAACLVASTLGPRHGLFQRLGLTATDLWIAAYAVALLRRRTD